MITKADYILD